MKIGHAAFLGLLMGLYFPAKANEAKTAKEALQVFNEFIGTWKGSGGPEKARPEPRETWSESVGWQLRFKGADACLIMTIRNGRHWKAAELHYLPEKDRYQLDATTTAGRTLSFQGEWRDDFLILERADPKTGEVLRVKMNAAAEGIRFIYRIERKPPGRSLFFPEYQVACTREGESLVAQKQKVECVVSGGLGTIPVSFKGATYYVCCTGCRDAFMENPEKFVREFEAKKAKK